MQTVNLNLSPQKQRFSVSNKQTERKSLCLQNTAKFQAVPSAANLRAYALPKLSFGSKEIDKSQLEKEKNRIPLRKLIPDKGMNLRDFDLSCANACGANLSNCEIYDSTNLKYAFYDKDTKFPATYTQYRYGEKIEAKFKPGKFGMRTLAQRRKAKSRSERIAKRNKAIDEINEARGEACLAEASTFNIPGPIIVEPYIRDPNPIDTYNGPE